MTVVKSKENSVYNTIGLYLSIMYVFFSFVANGTILPYALQQLALYILIGYGAIVMIIEIIKRRYTISSFSMWYLAILFLCILTNLYSNTQEWMPGNLYNIIVCFILTMVIFNFIRSEKDFVIYCWGNIITSILMAFLLFVTGKLYGTRLERLGDDISGNANVFAMGMMYPCMLAIWLMIYGQYTKKIKLILLFSIIVDMYAITLSAGRKSFIIPFIYFYILLILKKGDNKKNHFIRYSLMMIIIIYLAYELVQNTPILYDSVGVRIEQMLSGLTGKGKVDTSSIVRSEFRKIAIEGWLESPIWGHGFDSFKSYARERTGYYAYSHCNQTELLYCGGLMLFFAYYGAYAFLYYKSNNRYLSNKYSAFIKAAIISEFIFEFGLVSYNLFFVQNFIMMSFIVSGFVGEEEYIQYTKESNYKYIR